jgi:hypothetical protein
MRAAVTYTAVTVLAAGLVALSGCGESTDVTLHKPGVYKGAKDPLVEKQRDPKQQELLLARFNQVQTDR